MCACVCVCAYECASVGGCICRYVRVCFTSMCVLTLFDAKASTSEAL